MKKHSLIFCILFLVFVLSMFFSFGIFADEIEEAEKHADVDYSVSCMECHEEETPDQTNEWKESAHGDMNFGCYMCHGDGEEEYYPIPNTDGCSSCHSEYEMDSSESSSKDCFDCHEGHTLMFHHDASE